LAFHIFLFSLCCAFLDTAAGYGFEKKHPLPIPPGSVLSPRFSPEGESDFCTIQYDKDSAAFYFDEFSAGDGISVYIDPESCGFDSTYPFKLTNVHFYLFDPPPGFFIWPVEINVIIRATPQPEDSIQEPGNVLHSKIFSIPQDSVYDPDQSTDAINLNLDTAFCVYGPFFLEILYTGGTVPPYPSLVMSDSTDDRPDTNDNWVYFGREYREWYDFWNYWDTPGRAILRATGYPQAIDCQLCWRWMPKATKASAGMPDFDQHQFSPDSVSLCGPTALANCLVWLDAIPSITDADSLIRLLSHYIHADPSASGGTLVDSLALGLDSLFADYGLSFYDTVFQNPTFRQVSDSLKKSISTVLLLGFWQRTEDTWRRIGGHYVSPAGACDISSWIAISDPAADNTEAGAQGRILPPHDPHPDDHILHNTKGFVSHDAYLSGQISIEPYAEEMWLLQALEGDSLPWLSQFEGQNFQPYQQQYAGTYDPAESLYAVVEYAIMIMQTPVLVMEEEGTTPPHFELIQSYPNPFNNSTVIEYRLQKPTEVSLTVYNVLGQKVRTLVTVEKQGGLVKVIWDGKDDRGRDLSSGIYFYRLRAGEVSQTRKMVLLK
jgi:hypothetical protein